MRVTSHNCLVADHDIVFSFLKSEISIRSPLTDLEISFRKVIKNKTFQNTPLI